jgi:hypothetical protein
VPCARPGPLIYHLPMASGSPRSLLSALRTFSLAALWTLTAAWMVVDGLRDPYDPSREGSERYGHNHESALRDGLLVSLVELAVLCVVLQPWKKGGRSWLRLLAMLIFLVPWTLFSAMLCMHAGGIAMIHLLWLLAVVLVLVAALVVSGAAGILRR